MKLAGDSHEARYMYVDGNYDDHDDAGEMDADNDDDDGDDDDNDNDDDDNNELYKDPKMSVTRPVYLSSCNTRFFRIA